MVTTTAIVTDNAAIAPNGSSMTIQPTDQSGTVLMPKNGDQTLWDPPLFVAGSRDRALTFTLKDIPTGTTSVNIALQNQSRPLTIGPKQSGTLNEDGTWTVIFPADSDFDDKVQPDYHLGTGPDNSSACFSAAVTITPGPTMDAEDMPYVTYHYWTMPPLVALILK